MNSSSTAHAYVGSADASFKLRSNTSSHSGACSSAKNALRCRPSAESVRQMPSFSSSALAAVSRSAAGYAAL